MNDILHSYLDKFCMIYLNDILIYSRIEKQHKKHVHKILKMLEKIRMILNLDKCKFNPVRHQNSVCRIFTNSFKRN